MQPPPWRAWDMLEALSLATSWSPGPVNKLISFSLFIKTSIPASALLHLYSFPCDG